MEVLFYTDSIGQPFNINVVEIPNGQSVTVFKEGVSLPNTLCRLKDDYLVSAIPNKSVLNVFEMNRRNLQSKKIVTPGVVKALCTSQDGLYIAAGVEERVLLWDTVSGELLATLAKHYQDVTCLCFTNDSSFLISGGLDGMITAWDMSDLVDICSSDLNKEPLFCKSIHSFCVTCVYCSSVGGSRSRIFSSSSDRTIKVQDIALGSTLLTMVFGNGVSRFCVDSTETVLFAGLCDGSIYKVNLTPVAEEVSSLLTSSVNIDVGNLQNSSTVSRFVGHQKAITCLAIGADSSIFASGSEDETVRLWDSWGGQCIHTINAKTSITNLMIAICPQGLTSSTYKPAFPFPRLARALTKLETEEQPAKTIQINDHLSSKLPQFKTSLKNNIEACLVKNFHEDAASKLHCLHKQVSVLKDENRKLYEFALNDILPS